MTGYRVCLLAIALTACSSDTEPPCRADPAHFCEIFLDLNQQLSSVQRGELRAMDPDVVGDLHFDLGMYVRNAYGLWEDNPTTRYFRSIGIEHPDSMSGPVIAGYIHYLRGEAVNMLKVSEVQEPYQTGVKALPEGTLRATSATAKEAAGSKP